MEDDSRSPFRRYLVQREASSAKRLSLALLLAIAAVALAAVSFLLHVNLSTAGSVELLLVLIVALRLGFLNASVVSFAAFLCLNFFFTEPVFTFAVVDPQNWVSLFTFEATALLVSGLSTQVRLHADRVEHQRVRAVKLYDLSRAILLIEQRDPLPQQLSALIRGIFSVDEVCFHVRSDGTEYEPRSREGPSAQASGRHIVERDDYGARVSRRLIRLGGNTLGDISMHGWEVDSLTADAVASLCAIALERARASQREARAELERDAERLRTAVLDSLAHGFKTPLTAIKMASSGLITLNRLNETQAELVSIIDDRATMLSLLTTRLLQTATLEAKEMRVRRSSVCWNHLLQNVTENQDQTVRSRISAEALDDQCSDRMDPSLIELSLQQLLDNAAKYSAVGTPINIRIAQMDTETFIVVENKAIPGQLIPEGERTRIFERFYRAPGARSGPAGTGLGLSIVRKIAQAHGGRAWVECAGDDTRFIFTVQRQETGKHG